MTEWKEQDRLHDSSKSDFFSTDYLKAAKGITNKTSKDQESVSNVKKVPESLQKLRKCVKEKSLLGQQRESKLKIIFNR